MGTWKKEKKEEYLQSDKYLELCAFAACADAFNWLNS